METPKISIITVGMNHLNYLKDLLPSVYNNITPPPDRPKTLIFCCLSLF